MSMLFMARSLEENEILKANTEPEFKQLYRATATITAVGTTNLVTDNLLNHYDSTILNYSQAICKIKIQNHNLLTQNKKNAFAMKCISPVLISVRTRVKIAQNQLQYITSLLTERMFLNEISNVRTEIPSDAELHEDTPIRSSILNSEITLVFI